MRGQGTFRDGHSWYFAAFNRNKKSIVLDLYSPAGKAALRRLLAEADVVVENFRPGTMGKMGLGVEELARINPRLILASINGWGRDGPYADRPAFDFVVQAMSGFMSVNGSEGTPPMRTSAPITDLVAGIYAALGIVSAVRAREKTGRGQQVEVAMLNAVLSLMAYLASEYFVTDRLPSRTGNDHPLFAPYGLYRCADGEIATAPSNDTILARFMEAIDLAFVLTDPRYDSNEKRFGKRDELRALIEARLEARTQDYWIAQLNAAGVPCGKVQDFGQVFSDPQVAAQEMSIAVDHPGHGPVTMLGFPMKLSDTSRAVRLPAPELGAHTHTVLTDIGLSPQEITAAQGVLQRESAGFQEGT